jgi:outer membrane protein TolC
MAAFAVRQQYFTLIEAIKLLEVSQEDQRLASEEQKRTESLFEVGSVARTDVLKARVRVAEAQSILTASENRVQLERGRLATALALSPNEPLQVIESLDPRSDLPDSSSAYAEAASNRHDLSAARMRLKSASASKKAAYTSKLPFLSHAYNYSIVNSPQDFDVDPTENTQFIFIKPRTKSWSYQIGLTWNIFDGLVTEASIATSKAQERQAEHSMESLSLQVQLEVKEALLNIRATRRQIETAREALASAEEDLKLSQERYSVGLGTILELIDAQVNLTRARTGEVQAMAALKRAEAQLDRAVGRASW